MIVYKKDAVAVRCVTMNKIDVEKVDFERMSKVTSATYTSPKYMHELIYEMHLMKAGRGKNKEYFIVIAQGKDKVVIPEHSIDSIREIFAELKKKIIS